MKKLIKPLLIALGILALAIGTVGIAVPVLPTTPLYLLAAFCFARGSEKFHTWFIGTSLYKKRLDSFVRNRAMTLKAKLSLCISVSAMLAPAIYFAPIWHAKVLIVFVGLFKWWYFFFRIKTLPKASPKMEGAADD